MLSIDDLSKLKITSIKNVIHFKYKDEFYFIHENSTNTTTTTLYKGRTKYKNEPVKFIYGFINNLIKYKNNKKVLSAIDKENFVEKLYSAKLINTNIKEIKEKVKYKQQRLKELNKIIEQAENEIMKINWDIWEE